MPVILHFHFESTKRLVDITEYNKTDSLPSSPVVCGFICLFPIPGNVSQEDVGPLDAEKGQFDRSTDVVARRVVHVQEHINVETVCRLQLLKKVLEKLGTLWNKLSTIISGRQIL